MLCESLLCVCLSGMSLSFVFVSLSAVSESISALRVFQSCESVCSVHVSQCCDSALCESFSCEILCCLIIAAVAVALTGSVALGGEEFITRRFFSRAHAKLLRTLLCLQVYAPCERLILQPVMCLRDAGLRQRA